MTYDVSHLPTTSLVEWATRLVLLRKEVGDNIYACTGPIQAVAHRAIDAAAALIEEKAVLLETEQRRRPSPSVAQLIVIHRSYVAEILALKTLF